MHTSIKTAARPTYQFQIQPVQHRIKKGIAQSSRRAKVLRLSTGRFFNCVLRKQNFLFHSAHTHDGKIVTMLHAVIFNVMTFGDHSFHQLGMCLHLGCNTEKRGLDIFFGQNIQHKRRD